jgi:hypothetical protein
MPPSSSMYELCINEIIHSSKNKKQTIDQVKPFKKNYIVIDALPSSLIDSNVSLK